MNKSIQQFCEKNTGRILKRIVMQVKEGEDIGQISDGICKDLCKLGLSVIAEILEDMDDELRGSEDRKKHYEIVHKRKNSFLTRMGEVTYRRTCFKDKRTGKTEYTTDRIFGIRPHENIASDVETHMIEEALQTTYRKGGKQAVISEEELSKQTVMNYISRYGFELPEAKEEPEQRKSRIIYIEADEDHVALQEGGTTMPRLVYVHEGAEKEGAKSKRRRLKNVKYFDSMGESSTDLWERVLDYVYSKYDYESIDRIYISGDGASWIKAGTGIIDKSRFVLDRYHLRKYLRQASSHMDIALQDALNDAIYEADKDTVTAVLDRIVGMTEEGSKRDSVMDAYRYIMNNWSGIRIYSEEREDITGCSAEGHVSHIYSSRLSSRPKGWSVRNVGNMAKLIVYSMNGGKIIDLVKYRRSMEDPAKKEEGREEPAMVARARKEFYNNVSIPVISQGKRTQLRWLLKEIRGVC